MKNKLYLFGPHCIDYLAMERLNLGWPHRKFRPNLQEYKGNYKDW